MATVEWISLLFLGLMLFFYLTLEVGLMTTILRKLSSKSHREKSTRSSEKTG